MKCVSFVTLLFTLSFGTVHAQEIEFEQPAQFPGGIASFYEYVAKHLKYPKEARKKGMAGKVYIEFIIAADGSVDQDSIRALSAFEMAERIETEYVHGVVMHEPLVNEAIRVIRKSPKWIPGTRRGEAVRQKVVLPINFAFDF
jgi:periplasmic protein TonB